MWKSREAEAFNRLARGQAGRVTWAQLRELGAPDATIARWTKTGYLTRVLPKVYAVGHDAPNAEADLWAAVLYAGPGAMLSHQTGAHHRGLIRVLHRAVCSTPQGQRLGARGPRRRVLAGSRTRRRDGRRCRPSSRAQRRRDRGNELKLRAHGLRVVRYDWALLHEEPRAVRTDLLLQIAAARPDATRT